jgi:heme exporter protein B
MAPLIQRDLLLAVRTPSTWLLALVFFGLFLLLCAVALGGSFGVMRPLAPALIWLAVIFSQLLAFNGLFRADFEDGTLEQLTLSGMGTLRIVLAKAVVFFLFTYLPLLIAIPLAGFGFALPAPKISGICLSLIFAAPALIAYGVMSGAILAGRPQGGFISVILTVPFIIPVLIFGVAAVDSYPVHGLSSLEFRALGGLSLIGCAIGFPAASAALTANME